ncbi:MAG TPA: HAD family acid phosphatase [Sphingomonas sp.]|nr:HAD family acid phosphatase [Sphingomonas sp.]
MSGRTKRLLALASALMASGCATVRETPAPVAVPASDNPPPGFQYEYGSGEAGALQMAAFHAMLAYVADKVAHRPGESVVLAEDATLATPKWVPCGDKPFAVIFDVDETLLINLGFEERAARGEPYSPERWDAWERTGAAAVEAMPGALHGVEKLRGMKVTVVFNTNRSARNADATIAALKAAGLGDAVHGETLFLQGDDAMGSRKDGRRWTIAAKYCVLAMVGDQLGDFTDLYNAIPDPALRRTATIHGPGGGKWGKGWFVLPNPVYGTALKGSFDQVFPLDKRWAEPPKETKH